MSLNELSSSLLNYILSLLSDDEAAAEYFADPEAALAAAGLAEVCAEDVEDVLPLVLDYAPVAVASGSSSGGSSDGGGWDGGGWGGGYGGGHGGGHGGHGGRDRDDHGYGHKDKDDWGGHGKDKDDDWGGHHKDKDWDKDGDKGGHGGGHGGGHNGGDDHGSAVQQIHAILNNYSYTNTETKIDNSIENNIWAKGDVTQVFGDDNEVAVGNTAVSVEAENIVVGDDNNVGNDQSETDIDVDIEDSTFVNGDGNVTGDDNEVGNTAIAVEQPRARRRQRPGQQHRGLAGRHERQREH